MAVLLDEVLTGALMLCKANSKLGLHFDDDGCVFYDHGTSSFIVRLENLKRDFITSEASQAKAIERIKRCYLKHGSRPAELWLNQVPPNVPNYAAWYVEPYLHYLEGRKNVVIYSAINPIVGMDFEHPMLTSDG